jgi:subtilisin family serine protease
MSLRMLIPGLGALQARTRGDGVRVAILDGPVDVTHPCFDGARLSAVQTLVHEGAGPGRMSRHGTSVASIVLGQPGGPLPGVAPAATGLLVPVFQDYREGELPQLDLARAVEQAVLAGANVINISGGQRAAGDAADPFLERALQSCEENDVLVVAAAGNDGCDCVHVPAALPTVLAVGALGRDGVPLPSSNWGAAYRRKGLLAMGEAIPAAVPGGGTAEASGTSFATPIVAGVAALLMSLQLQARGKADARAVRAALLSTATGCVPSEGVDCDRYLAGVLDIPRAHAFVLGEGTREVTDVNGPGTAPTPPGAGDQLTASTGGQAPTGPPYGTVPAQGWGQLIPAAAAFGGVVPSAVPLPVGPDGQQGWVVFPAGAIPPAATMPAMIPAGAMPAATVAVAPGAVSPSGAPAAVALPPEPSAPPAMPAPRPAAAARPSCGCGGAAGQPCQCGGDRPGFVYALGTIGFDFGTETRRDTFRQLMPQVLQRGAGPGNTDVLVDANPFDVFQLSDYLENYPNESTSVIWTLNLDLTPIYAIESEPYYPETVYWLLRQALRNQALEPDQDDFVARVSVPAVMTGRTVQLFSGQVVPVICAQRRGMYSWNETRLLDEVIRALQEGPDAPDFDEPTVRMIVRSFLDKVYFQCRNLGQAPSDRALNFAVTNAYQFGNQIAHGLLTGRTNVPGAEEIIYTLDTIEVVKSPYCRIDSDCWDVRVRWFNPENDRSAKSVFQFTIDVNDVVPASLAPAHQFLTT